MRPVGRGIRRHRGVITLGRELSRLERGWFRCGYELACL
jgi:hypothetical protein